MPKSPFREGLGSLCPRPRKTRKPRTVEALLRGLGLTPKLAYAMRAGITLYAHNCTWSADQLAHIGLCSPATISRGRKILFREGLIEEVSPYVFEKKRSQKNRAAQYRFTPKAYLLLSPRRHRLAKCTLPLGSGSFESTSRTYQEHHHQRPTDDAHASGDNQPKECIRPEVEETVKVLVEQAGLDEAGARTAAVAISPDLTGEILPHLVSVALAAIKSRGDRVHKPKALLHFLLTSRDPVLAGAARNRFEKARTAQKEAARTGADIAWLKAVPAFKGMPGAQEALLAWIKTKQELGNLPEGHTSRQTLFDYVTHARSRVVSIAAEAMGAGPRPQGFVDGRRWSRQILVDTGLGEWA